MANNLIRKKPNRLLTGRRNYYNFGSFMNNLAGNPLDGKLTTGAFKGMSTGLSAGLSAAGTAVGQLGGSLISGGMTSGAGNVLLGLSGVASAIPGPWGAVASAGLGLLGGLTNRMFGTQWNEENIAKVEGNINQLNSFQSDAADYDTLANNWANAAAGMTFDDDFIGKDGWFSNKAKDKAAELRRQVERGNQWVLGSLNNNAQNIATTQAQNLLANFSAFGGPLFAFGGDLQTHGANFDTGLTVISNGGTHEGNPYEGVPMGVDQEGTPNLVEEGEVIYNNYVFSNRLKVPKAVRNKYKLRGNKPLTYADAAMEMAKEAEERPNDPISKNGLEAMLGELGYYQEKARERKNAKKYALGGELFNKYGNGTESYNNYPGGASAVNPYDWSNFVYNGVQLYNPGRREYNNMYTQEAFKQFVRDNYETLGKAYWNDKTKVPNWDKNNKNKIPTLENLLGNENSPGLMYDGPFGNPQAYSDAHNFGLYMLDQFMQKNPATTQYKVRLGIGKDAIDFPEEYTHYDGDRGGYTWDNLIDGKYKSAGSPVYDPDTNTTTYYYDPVEQKAPGKVFFRDDAKSSWSAGETQGDANKRGVDWSLYGSPHEDEDGNKYYTKLQSNDEMPIFDNALRYAPIAGALTGLGMSLFSKPDESSAEAILEASRGAGTYQPVRFRPVGNYLTYRPFDTEFAANQANAESAATRRAIMNTSGGNRATAMAGILAADNNALNQLGILRRGAAEDNRRQEQIVEDFNRATNEFNSEGFLKADMSNQSALMNSRESTLRGVMAAEELRQRAKMNRDNAIQANLTALFDSLGNIGAERVARKQTSWLVGKGYVPGLGKNEGDKKAHGGPVRRRKKGLTY